MNKMGLTPFTNGSEDWMVAPKSIYQSPEEFLKDAEIEVDEVGEYLPSDVQEGYVRYLPKAPLGADIENGYFFCEKESGAFPVYFIKRKSK